MKEKVFNMLAASIDNVFLQCQNELGITSGDVDPLEVLKLDELTEELTNTIIDILENQKGGF